MIDPETRHVLCAILAMMREQAIYLRRQRAWLTALADTIELKTDLGGFLKEHPFFDQPPRQDEQIMHDAIQHIDALIQQLKRQA